MRNFEGFRAIDASHGAAGHDRKHTHAKRLGSGSAPL